MENKIKYPVGEQSFERLRKEGFLYIDKTSFVERIISGEKYYFLARPRRFGKSLFLSTLKAFFEGRKDLFQGLYAENIDWDWEDYPVFHLDFNSQRYHDHSDLNAIIENFLIRHEKQYGIEVEIDNFSIRFENLIRTAYEKTGLGVVILVDEYDKPLVNNFTDSERFEEMRAKLAALYSNFKSSADYIRLVFLTGVSRFGKLSVFSDLNNISDISFDDSFAAICGITQKELLENCNEGIATLASDSGRSLEEEIVILKKRYDGYHFSRKCVDIYNPYSILAALARNQYGNYWIESGNPKLLLDQLKLMNVDLEEVLNARCDQSELSGLDLSNLSVIPLFYQTGYLTIKDYNRRRDLFQLGLPNDEVREGFFRFILPYYTSIKHQTVKGFMSDFLDEIEGGETDKFLKRLQSMLAGISYDMKMEEERNVQNAIIVLFTLLGLEVDAEYRLCNGRIDMLIRTRKYVYIMELKYDSNASVALDQIIEKGYALPWGVDRREVIAIGINYSSKKRCIDDWIWKQIQ